MADLTDAEKKKIMEDMKKSKKKREAARKKELNVDKKNDMGVKEDTNDILKKYQDLQKKYDQLKLDKEEIDKENGDLKRSRNDNFDEKKYLEQQKAMDSILADSGKKYFSKKYEFKDDGGHPYNFVIKMHYPNALELSGIEQEYVDMTNERGDYFSNDIAYVIRAIATFKVVGDEVPDEFKDPTRIYRYDIVAQVFADYNDWADSFREHYKI